MNVIYRIHSIMLPVYILQRIVGTLALSVLSEQSYLIRERIFFRKTCALSSVPYDIMVIHERNKG